MIKFLKVFLVTILSITAVVFGLIAIVFILPPSVEFDAKKLITKEEMIKVYDSENNQIECSRYQSDYLSLSELPKHTQNAFIAIEDKNFYNHKGLDYKRIIGATLNNIKSFSYKQGASTISQQVIKNTHLSSKKTLKRKIDEIKLTKKLEKQYSKDKILEIYLNTIYFGENAYGIEQASNTYFSKSAKDLTINESATLASIIVAPSKLNPIKNKDMCKQRRNLVLTKMREQGMIDNTTEINCKNEDIILNFNNNYETSNSYYKAVINEFDSLLEDRPNAYYNCKIYTDFNIETQKLLTESRPKIDTDYQSIVLDNKSGNIIAYYSTCGEIERNIASTAKPILVYAPAIEENLINQYTIIKDEKTDFNGYSPSNYGDIYYGNVSARRALNQSLNIPAVKVLNTLGIEKSKSYAKKLDIKVSSSNLGIALGAFDNGIKLKNLASAYSTFANSGQYKTAHFIKYIEDSSGKIIYKNTDKERKVFSSGTASIINDILLDTKNVGTTKALRNLNFDVCSKTGTNGNENGNLDAYSIAYTTDSTFAVWVGNSDNSYFDNSITGSNHPTISISNIISNYYKENKPNSFQFDDIKEVIIDKYEYENNQKILLADPSTPEKYKFSAKFRIGTEPKSFSTAFTLPKLNSYSQTVSGNHVTIKFDTNEQVGVIISKKVNGKNEIAVYDGKDTFQDEIEENCKYQYYLTPYIVNKNGKVYGDKTQLSEINTKKTNTIKPSPNNWWEE